MRTRGHQWMLTWKKNEFSLCGLDKNAGRERARTVGSSQGSLSVWLRFLLRECRCISYRSGPSEVIVCDGSSEILSAQVGTWMHVKSQIFWLPFFAGYPSRHDREHAGSLSSLYLRLICTFAGGLGQQGASRSNLSVMKLESREVLCSLW